MQYRKSINVIQTCKECPCNRMMWAGDQKTKYSCCHSQVKNIYKRILEYYPETKMPLFDTNEGPSLAFSEKDQEEVENNGFPYWCPLERSK